MNRLCRWPAGAIALVLAGVVGQAGSARADVILDPVGDFNTPFYTGPTIGAGAIDVIRAGGQIEGNVLHLFATMAAPVSSATAVGVNPLYVWGIQTGPLNPPGPFANVGNPNVLFNRVFTLNGLTGATNNAAVTGHVSGADVDLLVPLSLFGNTAFAPTDYRWNLWPRDANQPAGNGQISDFAPGNATAAFTTPEPLSMVVFGGLVGVGGLAAVRRRKA